MALTENQRKWVEALRSGKYQQGRGWLNHRGKMCCLGVACEVAIENGVPVDRQVSSSTAYYDDQETTAPDRVMAWLGLTGEMGSYVAGNNRRTDLATRNDKGWGFAKIADLIESEPKELFLDGV